MPNELSAEDSVTLSGLGSIVTTVGKLLADGVAVGEVAEKVVAYINPGDAAALGSLVSVLEEVEGLLSKA